MKKIKVALYEDNVGLRDVLADVVRSSSEFELAGEFGHCLDAIKNTTVFSPDVIIMDIDLPGKSGIDATTEIKSLFPKVEIIINTVFDDDDRVFNAIKAGASGYLLKKNSLSSLQNSILDVTSGGAPMSPIIARKLLLYKKMEIEGKSPKINLTDREYEIVSLLSKGYSYKMVADQVHLSLDTIRTHIKSIYSKLHVHSVTEAVHKVFIKPDE